MVTAAGRVLSELVNIYDKQRRIAMVLPQLAKPGISAELRTAIGAYIKHADERMAVVEKITTYLGHTVLHATTGLLLGDEGKAQEFRRALSLSAALISALEKVEFPHVESYSSEEEWEAATSARLLGWANDPDNAAIANLIAEILRDEKFVEAATISRLSTPV
ncbi:MAG: hypothetical protein ABI162_04030 [Luteolibacter sp.]